MSLAPKLSLRSRLLSMLLLAFAALAGLVYWQAEAQRALLIDAASERLLAQARLVAARQQSLIERADAVFNSMVSMPALSRENDSRCASLLSDLQKAESAFVQIAKLAVDGDLLCSAVPARDGLNFANQDWFRQALESNRMVVADVSTAPVINQPVITLAKAMRDEAGRPLGVFELCIALDWLQRALVSGGAAEGVRMAVIDGHGMLVATHPDLDGAVGHSFADRPLIRKILAAGGEGTSVSVALDQLPRLVAHVPLLKSGSGQPYYLLLGQSLSEVEAPADRQLMIGLILALSILAATLGLVFWGTQHFLVRPLRALSRTARRFGTGDFVARSGLPHGDDEIGQLTRSLEGMAAALAESTVSRQRLQEEIDEHRRAERRLQRSQLALDQAVRIAHLGAWSVELHDRENFRRNPVTWSAEMYQILDYSPAEFPVPGMDLYLARVHPDDRQALVETAMQALAAKRPWRTEYRLVLPDGRERLIAESGELVLDDSGEVTSMFGAVQDITRQRRTESHLRESEALFRAIFHNNLDAALLTTPEGDIVAANGEARRVFGLNEEEFRALGRQGIVDVADPRLAPALAQRDSQGWFRGELTMIDKNGRKFPAEVSSAVFVGEGGRPMTSLLVRDITDRQREASLLQNAKNEAEQANNAKSRFLAAASHDLRQPLSALSVYAGLLGHTVGPSEKNLVAKMKDCIGSLSELLNDLLDLSKLEAGVVTPHVSDFSIAEVFASLVSVHGPEAELKGLRLRCVSSQQTGRTDMILFRRCLDNLISNAIRYTERGGVLIACRKRRGKNWVEVRDSGIGIPQDKTAEIFEEFKQLGDTARNKGSGLGLAIVAKTAALLGLEIRVCSQPGRGSVFALELPPGEAAPVLPEPPRVFGFRSLRIALVDDNPTVCQALAEGLRALGHQVVATGGKAALLAELDRLMPEIVISDYRLTQGETGYDVIMAVRERMGAQLPAIVITGDTDPNLLRSMIARGIIVIHKPIDLETLQAYIEDLTSQSS